MRVRATGDLPRLLEDEGFALPKECREARLVMGVDSALMIQYDVFLTSQDLVRLGRALQRLGEGDK